MTPTQNRIRELGKGRVNLIIGQTNIPSPRSLGLHLSLLVFILYKWYLLGLCSFSSDKMTSSSLLCCCSGVQISDIAGLT